MGGKGVNRKDVYIIRLIKKNLNIWFDCRFRYILFAYIAFKVAIKSFLLLF